MSQITSISSGGGGSSITSIHGNTGTATPVAGVINLTSQSGDSGYSVSFVASGNDIKLLLTTDSQRNTYIGASCGNVEAIGSFGNTALGFSSLSSIGNGDYNVGLGYQALQRNDIGNHNIGIGYSALSILGQGVSNANIAIGQNALMVLGANGGSSGNICLGAGSAYNLLQGDFNIAIGSGDATGSTGAGSNWTEGESSNICIGNPGTLGDIGVIRIGTTGVSATQQSSCFIAGINGVNIGSVATVVSMSAGEQLGTTVITAGAGITVTPGANTITIASTTGGLPYTEVTGATQALAVNNGYIMNRGTLITATLPAIAAQGSIIDIIGKGAGGWIIAQNGGQTVHFGTSNTTAGAGGSLASTAQYDCVELICTTANTDFVVKSVIGNLTVV